MGIATGGLDGSGKSLGRRFAVNEEDGVKEVEVLQSDGLGDFLALEWFKVVLTLNP